MMKKVLIITYYWPPAGGPGVQRWLKFATYLKGFGIVPVVYIPENPHYPIVDKELINEIPKDIEIISHPIKEPYRFAKLFSKGKIQKISSGIITKSSPSFLEKIMLWIRGNFFIPDARIGWLKPSVKFLKENLIENPVDAVITTGPPHSLHLIGLELKRALDLKWIADFRDPWTQIHYHKSLRLSSSSKQKHKRLESEVLNNADRVVVTSSGTKKVFEHITAVPIDIITNGFDISENIVPVPDVQFSFVHVGSLLSERNPINLWKALSEICSSNESFSQDLRIKLAGKVSEEVLETIQQFGLMDNCDILGYVPHQTSIQFQHNAQLLLLVEMNTPETAMIIPGKLFEYLASNRPIISIGPENSDIETIISETKSGTFFNYSELDTLKKQLLEHYKDYKDGIGSSVSKDISKYSRRELTKKMSETIKKVLE